jgi:uncharacterized protein YbaA (DUF1428 family)
LCPARMHLKQTTTPQTDKLTKDTLMPHYVDGFVLPIPKDKIDLYREIAQEASKIWREHGALEYRECVGDDLDVKDQVPFPRIIESKPDETVVFAWIVFESREHRDEVNAKVMAVRVWPA